eukprot:755899-Hanusia_phi.AAC.2
MAKRRLQCGSCGTIIKVSSRVFRPVCPQCQTAHTFIRCGRVECGTLMCLPENVNQFSCPRCNVQLARPGHSQGRSGPMAVRCGNTGILSFAGEVASHEIRLSVRLSHDHTWKCWKVPVSTLLDGTGAKPGYECIRPLVRPLTEQQVLPGTEEALKCRARQEEALRQKELRSRETKELAELCKVSSYINIIPG